jgi:hypothetical protein
MCPLKFEKIILTNMHNFLKSSLLVIFFTLFARSFTNAQEIRVIDNKGTIKTVRNNQVTTSATAPAASVIGDVWFDTSVPSMVSKIYDNSSVWKIIDQDKVTTSATAPTIKNIGDIWLDTAVTPNTLNVWDGNSWISINGQFWSLQGNTGTDAATDFIGTLDTQDLVLKTNNIEKLRVFGTKGQVLINRAPTFNEHPLVIRANGADVLAFQDANGTPKWHWNLIGNGLNFVESNIKDNRLFLEAGGNVGINTGNPEAMLDINTLVSPAIIPLRIRPNTTTPAGTASGEFHVAADGLLYAFDGTRGKWLSVDRNMIGWGRNSQNTTNEYLRQFNGAQSNLNGWRMIRDGTITAITVQSNANQTYAVQIRKNDSATVISSLAVSNAQGNHNTTINIDFNEGDFLQCYLNGTSIDYPQVLIEIAWKQ